MVLSPVLDAWTPDVTPFLVIDDVLEMYTWCISKS